VAELPDDMLDRIAAMPVAPMAHVYVEGRRGEVMAAFVRRERENQMRKPHIVHLTAILAAAAISLPLLVSTSSAFAASPRTTARVGTQLAGLKGHALAQASSVGSVSFAPSDRQGAVSATWTVGLTTSASGALAIGGTITINTPASTTFPSAASAYKVNGTTVTATPTTAAGTVTIATPVAVGDSSAISVVLTGVTNPAAGTYANSSFSISTSVDTVAANSASGLSFGAVVSGVSFSPSSSVSAGSANWTVGFSTSASGALAIGGTITINTPASTTFPSAASAYKLNGTTVTATPTTAAGTVTIATPVAVGNSSASSVVITGVTNPAAGTYANTSFSISTSADTAASTPASGQTFSVGSVNTTTGLGLSLASVAYGSETSEIFTVTVTGQSGDGYPEGTVTVYNSSTELCSVTLNANSAYSAVATCSLTAHELAGGSYSDVFATYSPGTPSSSNASYTYGTSSSTPVQAFSVASVKTAATTTTSLELSARRVTYGDEQVEQLSVSVSPQYQGATPTGTVTISGANCQITLLAGKGSCTLPATYFNAGNRQMVATYNGSSAFKRSASAKRTVTIDTATTTTSLELSVAQVTYGHEQVEQLSVSVSPQYPGIRPTGTVTISGANCQIGLSSGKGSCRLSPTQFGTGNRQMVATYNGNQNFRRSASAKQTISVVR
jgi:hypothetical protein